MRGIALLGYSGHAFVVAETIELMGIQSIGYFDNSEASINPFKLQYLGSEKIVECLEVLRNPDVFFFVSIGDNHIRKNVALTLSIMNFKSATVIHPASIISRLTFIEPEVFIAAGVKVNALASIGKGAILNTGCIVEHECNIGNYAHIAPGAVVAGNVNVGDGSFIGASSVIKQGINIGKNVTIGAGSVVVKDIPDNVIVAGNPAKLLKN